jgi:type IV secretion system protein VirD4
MPVVARWAVVVLGALLGAQYVAGYFFLWGMGLDPHRASPLTTVRYAYYYGDRDRVRARLLAASGTALALVAGVALALVLPRRRPLHGDARFARRGEIARAGLLGRAGIILGRVGPLRGRFLMLDGQQGVALAAPPRAGKGAGVVIPNALSWPGSLVCVDIKRENWTVTAGYRASAGQACFLFDPVSEDSARWNPLGYVSEEPRQRVNQLQGIADLFFPEISGTDPFWTASARSLFLGIALYLFETPSLPKTVGEILRQGMASLDEGFEEHWRRIVEGRKGGARELSPECERAIFDAVRTAPQTASGIRKTFTSRLDLWLNPILDAATSSNDFDLRELRSRPTSIYVGVNPADLHRLRPVLSLFFQQAIGLQTRELPEHRAHLKHQVLMLLDEFTALGRIPIIAEAISYLPGYNVRVVLVIQATSQLREVYGTNNAETMLKSLGARIVYAPKDYAEAREISDELGFTTVRSRSFSRPRFLSGGAKGTRGATETQSEQRRALLLPQEVKELGAENAIVFCEGVRPILCRKIRYFKDVRFRARLHPPPLVQQIPPAAGQRAAVPAREPEALPMRAGAATAQSETGEAVHVREGELRDLERADALKLEDFAIDFSSITVPTEGPVSDFDLEKAAEDFVAKLTER